MFQSPVSISHKSEPAIVPCHFSQEGEDKQQHLEVQEKHAVLALKHITVNPIMTFTVIMHLLIIANNNMLEPRVDEVEEQHSKSDLQTYQKAHEVKCKDSRHSTKRQALEHCAANSGGVTKFPGRIGWLRRAALRVRASLCSPDSHYQYQDSVHHCSMFTACKEESETGKKFYKADR